MAAAFEIGRGRTPTLSFTVGYVPSGYRLVTIGGSTEKDLPAGFVSLVTDETAKAMLTRPDHGFAPGGVDNLIGIRFELPRDGVPAPKKATCSKSEVTCRVAVGDYQLIVSGQPDVKLSEVRKVFESMEPADPADPATWIPAEDALPDSVRWRIG